MARDTTVPASPAVAATAAPQRRQWLAGSALGGWDLTVVVAVVLTAALAAWLVEGFARGSNIGFLLLDMVAIALVALPMTLIIVTGEIDLSVASILGLTSTVMGQLWLAGWPLELILPLCVVLGAVLGAVNGVFVTVFGLPSLAVTIGTLALYRGLAFVVLGSRAVADFPIGWTTGITAPIPGTPIPWVMIPLTLLALVFGVVLHATPVGRSLYVMGANAEAARFAGIAVERTKLWLFVTSGAVSSLAGLFWTLRYASARADNASGLELSVIAAVLLGGVSIFGGTGALHGVLAGVLLIGTLASALRLANVTSDVINIITGVLLVLSVVSTSFLRWLKTARSKPRRTRTVER